MDQRRRRQLCDELGERPSVGAEQLEQLREARDRVVGGQELQEDVAATDRAREDDAVGGRRLGQVGERVRGANDLEPAPGERLTLLVTVIGKGRPAFDAAVGEEAYVEGVWSTGTSCPCSSTR